MPANPQPVTIPDLDVEIRESASLAPTYHLVLLDDDDHTYEYVVEMLGKIFGYAVEKEFALACAVDSTGRAIVETGGRERVTQHQHQIHSFGADRRIPRCKGSMSAVVEPAE